MFFNKIAGTWNLGINFTQKSFCKFLINQIKKYSDIENKHPKCYIEFKGKSIKENCFKSVSIQEKYVSNVKKIDYEANAFNIFRRVSFIVISSII